MGPGQGLNGGWLSGLSLVILMQNSLEHKIGWMLFSFGVLCFLLLCIDLTSWKVPGQRKVMRWKSITWAPCKMGASTVTLQSRKYTFHTRLKCRFDLKKSRWALALLDHLWRSKFDSSRDREKPFVDTLKPLKVWSLCARPFWIWLRSSPLDRDKSSRVLTFIEKKHIEDCLMLTDESWGWDLGVKTMKKGWRPGFKPRDFLSSYQIYCRFDLAEVKWQNSPWHLNSLMVKKVPGLCVISCASSVLGISPYHLKSPQIPHHAWFFASLREVLRLRSHHRPTQKPHAATWNGYERSCPDCRRLYEIHGDRTVLKICILGGVPTEAIRFEYKDF